MITPPNSQPQNNKVLAAIALLWILINANAGIAASLYIPGAIGKTIYIGSRVLLLGSPIAWFLLIECGQIQIKWPSRRDFMAGTILGLLMAGVIAIAYFAAGKTLIDVAIVRDAATKTSLTNLGVYVAFGAYFTFINALVEEYVWRWFVYQKCMVIFPKKQAVYIAAFCFTLHHIIALAGYTSNGLVTALGSLGVFLAGAIWSWCFLRYESLWACYLSHAIADLAIALIGWELLFLA